VSALSGPCAKYIVEYEQTAEEAFQRSVPLEDLIAPEGDDPQVMDLNIRRVPDELREFLLNPQTGARRVAKRFFAQAASMRREVFAGVTDLLVPPIARRVFKITPIDQGHFGLPYYDHILRGLRLSLPEEVRSLLRDGTMPRSGEFVGLGGVAVVNI